MEVITPEIVKQIRGIVMKDRLVKVCEITETVDISNERVLNILHENALCAMGARFVDFDQKPHAKGHLNTAFVEVYRQS